MVVSCVAKKNTQAMTTLKQLLFYAYFYRKSMIFTTKSCKTRHMIENYEMNEIKLPLIHVLSNSNSKGGKPPPFCSKVTLAHYISIENVLWVWVSFTRLSFV